MNTIRVADSFGRLEEAKRSERIRSCGSYLEFTKSQETGKKYLVAANFCKSLLCPMCGWRRSRRRFYELSTVMDEVQKRNEKLVPLFLTLTLRNCAANVEELSKTLDLVFSGWHKFTNHYTVKGRIKGWFRALELTYNRKTDEFHPHIHVLILVNRSYFSNGAYLSTAEWVRLWRVSLGLDYDPVCDIRKVKNSGERRKDINEMSKYTVKDADFIFENDDALTDRLVSVLSKSLRRRRLYAFGGVMKVIAAELKFSEASEDLIHVGDETIRNDIAILIEKYRWHFGISQYVRVV